jgi:hypothetical protein
MNYGVVTPSPLPLSQARHGTLRDRVKPIIKVPEGTYQINPKTTGLLTIANHLKAIGK